MIPHHEMIFTKEVEAFGALMLLRHKQVLPLRSCVDCLKCTGPDGDDNIVQRMNPTLVTLMDVQPLLTPMDDVQTQPASLACRSHTVPGRQTDMVQRSNSDRFQSADFTSDDCFCTA